MGMLEDFYGAQGAARIRSESGFGASPTPEVVTQLSDEQKALLRAKMGAIVSALEAARARAQTVAESWSYLQWGALLAASAIIPGAMGLAAFTTPAGARDAVLSALRSSMKSQVNLRAVAMGDVLNGTLSFDKWLAGTRETAKGILMILSGLGETNAGFALESTISGIVNDVQNMVVWVAQKIRELPSKLPDTQTTIYIVGALALLVAYQYLTAPLKALPKRGLSGYSRRRRRRSRA